MEIRAHFAQVAAELESQCQQLGVENSLKDVPGITPVMLVAFGTNGIRTVEDLAACATDELVGWVERKGNRIKRHRGILDGLVLWAEECDSMILHARIKLGWISETPSQFHGQAQVASR
jgi:N utilization substance protein A